MSILPVISKKFERAINDQIVFYSNKIVHPYISAFRSGYGCETALLKIIEDWKKALDQHKFTAAILMNLSKTFDCLPHDLLFQKLEYYGTSKSALNLIQNYLSNRKQCVKLGTALSTWQDIYKGVPQVSIKVITKLPNSEQSYKGKVKTHNYINRQNQSTTGKL